MEEAVTAGGTTNRDNTVRNNSPVVSSSTRTRPEAVKTSCRNKARAFNSCLQGTFGMYQKCTFPIAKEWEKVR